MAGTYRVISYISNPAGNIESVHRSLLAAAHAMRDAIKGHTPGNARKVVVENLDGRDMCDEIEWLA